MLDQTQARRVYSPGRVKWEQNGILYTATGIEVPESVMLADDARIEEGLELEPDEKVLPALKREESDHAPLIPKVAQSVASPRANGDPEPKLNHYDRNKEREDLMVLGLPRLKAMMKSLANEKCLPAPEFAGRHAKAASVDWLLKHTEPA